DSTFHIKVSFRNAVVFSVEDFGEAFDGVFDGDEDAGDVGEDFSNVERLGEEALDFPGPEDGHFVVIGKLVHAENGDDILQVLIALEDQLNSTSNTVMFFTDDFRSK